MHNLLTRARRQALPCPGWWPLALLAISFSAGCSGAAPEPTSPAATATVEVAPVSGVAAPGDAKDPTSQMHAPEVAKDSHVATLPPSVHPHGTPPPNNPPPPGAGGPDKDFDGVADVNDLCLDVPEDRDGFEDADGCPEPDNDKDGVADVNDRCPDQPETKNGKKDEDGCPD